MKESAIEPEGPLKGLKVLELAGIGPGPLCAMLLSDLGANVLRIERNKPSQLGTPRDPKFDLLRRNRPSVSVDLKKKEGIETVLRLTRDAAVLIDPFRPGVTEKLGLGPDDCFSCNEKLVYARMTGWGQYGPLSQVAGHDINYLALTGILNAIGPKEGPVPPLNLVADMGGGAMFLAFGIMAAVYECQQSQKGQVVDVSMTEGSAYLATGNFGLNAAGTWTNQRSDNILDGGAHFYGTYQTKDDLFIALGSIEAKFYLQLIEKLGMNPENLPDQMDRSKWPMMKQKFTEIFKTKTRKEWCEIFEGTDVCFAPVLTFEEAQHHPHNQSRGSFIEIDGVVQPGPVPRFSRTPPAFPSGPPGFGDDTETGLKAWGFSTQEVKELSEKKAIGWQD
ncbi:MAG: CoA transferase [SAR324 cluster bacterium]|nr:CoA transferase [SAR324 cluster bacterium]